LLILPADLLQIDHLLNGKAVTVRDHDLPVYEGKVDAIAADDSIVWFFHSDFDSLSGII